MTVGEIQVMMVKIRMVGQKEGFTDAQIGAMDIFELHADRKNLVPVNFKIEFSRIRTRRKPGGENFINFEFKAGNRIAIVKS